MEVQASTFTSEETTQTEIDYKMLEQEYMKQKRQIEDLSTKNHSLNIENQKYIKEFQELEKTNKKILQNHKFEMKRLIDEKESNESREQQMFA